MHIERVESVSDGLALEARAFSSSKAETCIWMAKRRALVCPANLRRKVGFETALRNSAARGWPVHLRPTGGGAVPQGPGVLNLALTFTAEKTFTIEDGYRLITQIICDAIPVEMLAGATPHSFCDGAWNLSIGTQKVVGTAQRLRPVGGGKRRVLAHALILLEGDLRAGAGAVDAFHTDLGMPPISTDAHITLAEVLGDGMESPDALANALVSAAARLRLALKLD